MGKLLHPMFMWEVITYACPNFNVEVMAWMSDYFPLFNMGVITYPCPDPYDDLANIC